VRGFFVRMKQQSRKLLKAENTTSLSKGDLIYDRNIRQY
jgi:hypothetical protein